MDPLSDVLALLKPRSYDFRGFDGAGDWSIQFPRSRGLKLYSVVAGQCRLQVEGVGPVIVAGPGDYFLLPTGRSFRVASDLRLPPVDAHALFDQVPQGEVVVWNGGGECSGLGGFFDFPGEHAAYLLDVLPPVVHVRATADQASLRWIAERVMAELGASRPGGTLVTQHLVGIMLVEVLRLHLTEGSPGAGWLSALADKKIGAALQAMHAEPARAWTLQSLAAFAGMSRSSFAERFKDRVGATPLHYLARWRMLIAAERLAGLDEPVSAIGLSLGYASESAFSAAFRRVMGHSPRAHARSSGQRGALSQGPEALGDRRALADDVPDDGDSLSDFASKSVRGRCISVGSPPLPAAGNPESSSCA